MGAGEQWWLGLGDWVPLLALTLTVVVALSLINRFLRKRWRGSPELQFRFQLIMLSLSMSALLVLILALPISDSLRGQLLSLLGIVLSASIALASSTFIGNMMAGIMLRLIQNARPGDFIMVAEISGRITEMGLLHTEVQTEDRDLITVPNLFMVTQPLKRVRASGTIVSAEVSLGYDVSRVRAAALLREAAKQAGLSDGFVQVRALGDFSVLYRVAGLLVDANSLISARSDLREAMLDALHGADIEIVSPIFHNQRPQPAGSRMVPREDGTAANPVRVRAESVAFDKADEAATVESLRDTLKSLVKALDSAQGADRDRLQEQLNETQAQLEKAVAQHKATEVRERQSNEDVES